MPRVNWGIKPEVIDDFDRESQFSPYTGPIPPNGVYAFRIKIAKHVAGTREKNPQIRLGLELYPRSRDEKRYANYFIMKFIAVSQNEKAAFNYVPFCDAIGVSGEDFTRRTNTDDDGNIRRIGPWRNAGDTLILGQLQDGVDQNNNTRKEIGWVGPFTEDADSEFDDSDSDEEDEETADYDDDEAF